MSKKLYYQIRLFFLATTIILFLCSWIVLWIFIKAYLKETGAHQKKLIIYFQQPTLNWNLNFALIIFEFVIFFSSLISYF